MENRVLSDSEGVELDDKENLDLGNLAEPHGMIVREITDRVWRGHDLERLPVSPPGSVEDAAIARIDAKRCLTKAISRLPKQQVNEGDE